MMNESVTGLVWNGPNMFSSTGRWWRSHVARLSPLHLVVKSGRSIYLDSAVGVRTQQIPGTKCLLLRILFIRHQKCGWKNNNKDLVDRVKIVTAEVKGFKLYYLSWFNHKRQPALFRNHLEAVSRGLEDHFYLTQDSDLPPPPKKNKQTQNKNMKEKKAKRKQTGERSEVITYTLCCGDVHVATDEGQAVVHAHLEINYPGIKQYV